MTVSKELLDELKIILQEEYHIDLPDSEVEELAYCLISCFKLLSEEAIKEDIDKNL